MIEPDVGSFPNNIVMALKDELQAIDPEITILTRPIKKGDPLQCFSIVASAWQPDLNSQEFVGMGGGHTGPTLSQYVVSIQTFNQDMDEERGLAVQAAMATAVRLKLSRDIDVRVALAQLASNNFGYSERFTRSYVQTQRFISNEVSGQFLFLSSTELVVETEVS